MGHGIESCRNFKSEPAREYMEAGGNMKQIQSQSPEKSVMGETDWEVVTENSVALFKSGRHRKNNISSSQCHVCRFCSRVFSSGKALGGHVRIHAASRSNGQSSSSGNVSRGDYSSTDLWVKKSKVPTTRSNGNSNWVRADSIEEEGEEIEEEEEDYKVVKTTSMDVGHEELNEQKMVSVYTLRRNPKQSRRLTDEEFCMELTASAKNPKACVECGKEFPSSKALFGHMKCHPERDWVGIQPLNDNTNSTDDDSQYNTTGGDIVHAAAAPSSGLSSDCWQNSQGSEDLEEHGDEDTAASDNESDRESMKSMKTAHQPVSCSLFTWSVTAKRGRKRPLRFTQPQHKEDEETEVDNSKELVDDTDTAHFLVMLASSAINTNNTNKGKKNAERQMTDESVYHSKIGKRESQGSFEDLVAGQEDLGWKKKMKKKRTDKTSRPVDLGTGLPEAAGKYKCCTCKQLFNSHQALVGHRSSHTKAKGCFATTNVDDEAEGMREEEITEECSSVLMMDYHPDAVDVMDSSHAREEEIKIDNLSQELNPELAVVLKKGKGHECCAYHKVLPSGQVLGEHETCHWSGEDRVTETKNSVISTERQPKVLGGQARNVREFLFDLNEPAQEDEEDLEGAYEMEEAVPACTESVNQRIQMHHEAMTNGGFGFGV